MNALQPRRLDASSTTSPPYRDEDGGEVRPPLFTPVPCTSPKRGGEVRRGWRGRQAGTQTRNARCGFNSGDDRPRLSIDDLRTLYCELRYVHEARGKTPEKAAGTAFAQLLGNFKYRAPFAWRDLQPAPPTQTTINLEKSWRIAFAKRADKERRLGLRH